METPAYIIDEKLLTRNLEILAEIQETTGAKILLAQIFSILEIEIFTARKFWEFLN